MNTMTRMQHEKDLKPVNILIVDDDQVSVMSMQRTLKKMKIANPVRVARDGQEALDILRGAGGNQKILPPFLVTLDLNMPRMSGHEFLEELRADPMFQKVVVFVLSTSDTHEDVQSAYSKNVAGYIVKEHAADSFAMALDMIDSYAKLVVLPD